MKLFVYSYRDFDEGEFFNKYSSEYNIELGTCREAPTLENAYLVSGYAYISVITTKIDADLVTRFHELGVKMISTRTVGYDHIDLHKAEELGVQVSNVTYSPNCVADYTIMLMLMSVRKMKRIMERANINDFSLPGIQGREMQNFTIGIIGTGKIGRTVIKYLSGFGCKVYAYDLFENSEVKQYAEYVDLDTIYTKCDMISLHMPLEDSNYHLINKDSIAKMKDKVIIINTARGALIDSVALIEGLESGKVGAAGLDVVEKEFGLYYYDLKSRVLDNRELLILRGYPNVIVTPHMAFYTDQAIDDMVHHAIKSCWLVENGKENPWQVV
ncbi:MAG: D-isomer specific 2-hydroxyacid dehydrogenase, NAD-binding [Firmicutes bacterium]|nr:D-isomer specific 2-hydroxyacid dehydrogenase, NAD-binding [Bacillota bacterium]